MSERQKSAVVWVRSSVLTMVAKSICPSGAAGGLMPLDLTTLPPLGAGREVGTGGLSPGGLGAILVGLGLGGGGLGPVPEDLEPAPGLTGSTGRVAVGGSGTARPAAAAGAGFGAAGALGGGGGGGGGGGALVLDAGSEGSTRVVAFFQGVGPEPPPMPGNTETGLALASAAIDLSTIGFRPPTAGLGATAGAGAGSAAGVGAGGGTTRRVGGGGTVGAGFGFGGTI